MRPYQSIIYQCLHKLPNSRIRQSPATALNTKSCQRHLSSAKHYDLNTFIHHATSTALSPTSTVHVGTSYEYLCAHTLPRLGFRNLTRTGGRSDRGIDVLGHWESPSLAATGNEGGLHVIVQCKANARKAGPEMIRELEGAVAGAPGEWRGEGTIGVLCARREATDGVRQAVRRSERGIVWIMIEDGGGEGKEGKVRQILWNGRVGKQIGRRVGAGLRYVVGNKGMEKEVYLTLDGRVWEPEVGRDTP